MGTFDRITRLVKSWTGIFKGEPEIHYGYPEARVILTHLGIEFSSHAYKAITESEVMLEDFLQQLYAAEFSLGQKIIRDNLQIDPTLQPRVLEDGDRVAILIRNGEEEKILIEWKLPETRV